MPTSASSPTKLGSRWRRGLRRTLIALGLLVLVSVFLVIPYTLSWLLTHAKSRPLKYEVVATPQDYGVAYQTVKFHASDGTPLSAWWLPADSSPVVIIYCHGLFRSKLEMVERASAFRRHGYAGLVLDFRRHGDSGGALSSLGYLERLDVLGAVHFIRDSLRLAQPIVTFAVSMGTAAAMLAAAESPEITGLILDSSFLSFDNTIAHHARLFFGLPRFPIADAVILFTRWRIGFRSEAFDMRQALRQIGDRPLLFVAGSADDRMPLPVQQQLYAGAPSRHKKLVIVPGARHGAAYRTNPDLYQREVMEFLQVIVQDDKLLSAPAASSPPPAGNAPR
ncbi:MAG: alpha/beta hydrolase [candidate division KSB1 bacterium]|nr:alpha/beta hydrolase [candidate division KSB1 bacterium]MDZ7274876.1 alpha/beta hydrolase [candidate division KSB1 bacterium]MDZ7286672.1 alpha/beta hydrolase [candidate division KSB1 bacterium]MDZ7299165.1 alpha/beta hydrolase [candidate division KSB1 bacterium]MDZ7307025.1 alpha/beta hydrolase [candidate division KSB1 bacterium]